MLTLLNGCWCTFQVVKVAGVSLWALFREKKVGLKFVAHYR